MRNSFESTNSGTWRLQQPLRMSDRTRGQVSGHPYHQHSTVQQSLQSQLETQPSPRMRSVDSSEFRSSFWPRLAYRAIRSWDGRIQGWNCVLLWERRTDWCKCEKRISSRYNAYTFGSHLIQNCLDDMILTVWWMSCRIFSANFRAWQGFTLASCYHLCACAMIHQSRLTLCNFCTNYVWCFFHRAVGAIGAGTDGERSSWWNWLYCKGGCRLQMFSEASVVVVEYQMTPTRKFSNLGDASGVWETYRGEVGFAMRDHDEKTANQWLMRRRWLEIYDKGDPTYHSSCVAKKKKISPWYQKSRMIGTNKPQSSASGICLTPE